MCSLSPFSPVTHDESDGLLAKNQTHSSTRLEPPGTTVTTVAEIHTTARGSITSKQSKPSEVSQRRTTRSSAGSSPQQEQENIEDIPQQSRRSRGQVADTARESLSSRLPQTEKEQNLQNVPLSTNTAVEPQKRSHRNQGTRRDSLPDRNELPGNQVTGDNVTPVESNNASKKYLNQDGEVNGTLTRHSVEPILVPNKEKPSSALQQFKTRKR